MKTIVNTILCFLLLGSSAFAVPYLQLDIGAGTYNITEQTIVSNGDEFTLLALVDESSDKYVSSDFFVVSVALTPNPQKETPTNLELGTFSFSFNGQTYLCNATQDMIYGTPPADIEAKKDDLCPHGIFPTYYKEFKFSLNSNNTIDVYNSEPEDTDDINTNKSGVLHYAAFDVDVSNLASGYQLHFDLYTVDKTGKVVEKAPFSHDAESGGTRTPTPPGSPVPEPASILLLGFGLIGLSKIARKKFF